MSGWIWLWWLVAVGLSAIGTWLVLRGMWGHHRIASRTRRCPKCRYDMTGRPGVMTCVECGFEAQHEARFYGGRRRWWVAAAGVSVCVGGVGMLVVPESIERGGVAWVLPAGAQARWWPELVELGDESVLVRLDEALTTFRQVSGERAVAESALRRAIELIEADQMTAVQQSTAFDLIWGSSFDSSLMRSVVVNDEQIARLFASRSETADIAALGAMRGQTDRVTRFIDDLSRVASTPGHRYSTIAGFEILEDAIEREDFEYLDGVLRPGVRSDFRRIIVDQALTPDWMRNGYRDWLLGQLREADREIVGVIAKALAERFPAAPRQGWTEDPESLDANRAAALPFVEVMVAHMIAEDDDRANSVDTPLERMSDHFVPTIAQALGRAPTPRIAEDVLSVLRRHDGNASASLPYVEAYSLDPDIPFDWAKRAVDDHRYIRLRFDAEDDSPPIFAMPIFRRALAATDWGDPTSVAELMMDWPPHRDDGTVALAELIAVGDPSPFVSALAKHAAEQQGGDLVAELRGIADDDRLADETRAIAGRLAGELEEVWPRLMARDNAAP